MLKQIIQTLETATALDVVPLITDSKDEIIVYTLNPSYDNGAVSKQTLELRLITDSMATAETKRKAIISALVPSGDNESITGLVSCTLNGGGMLKDLETNQIQTILYLELITKSEN